MMKINFLIKVLFVLLISITFFKEGEAGNLKEAEKLGYILGKIYSSIGIMTAAITQCENVNPNQDFYKELKVKIFEKVTPVAGVLKGFHLEFVNKRYGQKIGGFNPQVQLLVAFFC